MAGEAAAECFALRGDLLAQRALGQIGEQLRVMAPRDQRVKHPPRGHAEHLGGDRGEPDPGVLQGLLDPLDLAGALLDLGLPALRHPPKTLVGDVQHRRRTIRRTRPLRRGHMPPSRPLTVRLPTRTPCHPQPRRPIPRARLSRRTECFQSPRTRALVKRTTRPSPPARGNRGCEWIRSRRKAARNSCSPKRGSVHSDSRAASATSRACFSEMLLATVDLLLALSWSSP